MKKDRIQKTTFARVCVVVIAFALVGIGESSTAQRLIPRKGPSQGSSVNYGSEAVLIDLFNTHNFPGPTVTAIPNADFDGNLCPALLVGRPAGPAVRRARG